MKTKIALSILGGLLIGIFGTLFVVQQTTVKHMDYPYLLGVMDQANVAYNIRAGKQTTLLNTIDSNLPDYVLTINNNYLAHESSMDALWFVKAYYQRYNITIPHEIKGIIDSLPTRPPTSCQLRLQALDNAPFDKNVEPKEAQ